MTVSYLASTHCRSWVKRQFAAPTIRGILGVELPSPDMAVPVTNPLLSRCHLVGGSGSIRACCTAQLNDSFLGSRLSCQKRRAAQSAMTCRAPSARRLYAALRTKGQQGKFSESATHCFRHERFGVACRKMLTDRPTDSARPLPPFELHAYRSSSCSHPCVRAVPGWFEYPRHVAEFARMATVVELHKPANPMNV